MEVMEHRSKLIPLGEVYDRFYEQLLLRRLQDRSEKLYIFDCTENCEICKDMYKPSSQSRKRARFAVIDIFNEESCEKDIDEEKFKHFSPVFAEFVERNKETPNKLFNFWARRDYLVADIVQLVGRKYIYDHSKSVGASNIGFEEILDNLRIKYKTYKCTQDMNGHSLGFRNQNLCEFTDDLPELYTWEEADEGWKMNLELYLTRNYTGDFELRVGDSKFRVHREVLIKSSPLFKSLFDKVPQQYYYTLFEQREVYMPFIISLLYLKCAFPFNLVEEFNSGQVTGILMDFRMKVKFMKEAPLGL